MAEKSPQSSALPLGAEQEPEVPEEPLRVSWVFVSKPGPTVVMWLLQILSREEDVFQALSALHSQKESKHEARSELRAKSPPGSKEQPRGRDRANEGKAWPLLTAPGLRTERKHKLHPKLRRKKEKTEKV